MPTVTGGTDSGEGGITNSLVMLAEWLRHAWLCLNRLHGARA